MCQTIDLQYHHGLSRWLASTAALRGPAEVCKKAVSARRASSMILSTLAHGGWLLNRDRTKFINAAICASFMLAAKPGMIGLRSPSTGPTPDSTILARLRGSGLAIAVLNPRLMPP